MVFTRDCIQPPSKTGKFLYFTLPCKNTEKLGVLPTNSANISCNLEKQLHTYCAKIKLSSSFSERALVFCLFVKSFLLFLILSFVAFIMH